MVFPSGYAQEAKGKRASKARDDRGGLIFRASEMQFPMFLGGIFIN